MKGEAFLQVFENTMDLVCIVDKAGFFVEINPAVTETLGYSREELFSEAVSCRIHPEDRQRTAQARAGLLNNQPLQNFRNRYLTKDGRVVWLHWTSVYLPEKELVFAIAKDVTEKVLEEMRTEARASKFEELTRHFKEVVETDRAFFAFELHEQLGQLATVIKMDLEWISAFNRELGDEALERRLQGAGGTVKLLIEKIRHLSYSMNTSQIDELGLDAVLKAVCSNFRSVTNMACVYTSSFEEQNLTAEIKRDLFRICQQALAAIANQQEVTEVRICLQQEGGIVELTVQTDGKDYFHERKSSFEFQMLQGRVASINGALTIESAAPAGTTITVRIPSHY